MQQQIAVELRDAALRFGERTLWQDVNLSIHRGEFIAILGPNGAGKSTLLKAILGLQELSAGKVLVGGEPVRAGSRRIGYVPQQKSIAPISPIRGVDLVRFGLDGHRWGIGLPSASARAAVQAAIRQVGAEAFANRPIARLSGGEQQRLRIAQALVTEPELLLCDEPLLSLDIASQRQIVELIDDQRQAHNLAVLFVTHEINPVLPLVDRVIYIARGRAVIGSPDQVMRTEVLSNLYGSPVQVVREHGRILVFAEDTYHNHHPHHEPPVEL